MDIDNDAMVEQIAEALAEEFGREPTKAEINAEAEKLDYEVD